MSVDIVARRRPHLLGTAPYFDILADRLPSSSRGAFVGGELFVVLGGPTTHKPDYLTLFGAVSGGLLCLELVSRLPPSGLPAADTRVGVAWLSLQLWSPVLFAAAIGVALGRASGSPLLGVATTAAVVMLLLRWYQYHARVGQRR